jgi:hypothetical protein
MIINFNQLDQSRKNVQFLDGIFPLETDRKFSWVWTSKKINGIVSNVEFITIKALSEIDNTLTIDGNKMNIKSDCLNIVKFNTSGKSEFEIELDDVFIPPNDDRQLGIKIIGILIDGEIIF